MSATALIAARGGRGQSGLCGCASYEEAIKAVLSAQDADDAPRALVPALLAPEVLREVEAADHLWMARIRTENRGTKKRRMFLKLCGCFVSDEEAETEQTETPLTWSIGVSRVTTTAFDLR